MHLKSWTNLRLLFAPDGTGGDDGENESELRDAGFASLISRYKEDATGMAKDLYADNFKLRSRNTKLKSDLDDAKKLAPSEGSVVLDATQATAWAAYQALGTPEQVKTAVEERGSLQGRLDTMEREGSLQRVATLAGFNVDVLKDADALTERDKGKKPIFSVKKATVEGKEVETPYIKVGDEEKPLAEYAQENWSRLLPSLTNGSEANNSSSRSSGTYFPSQHQGSGGGGSKPQKASQQVAATLDNRYPKKAKD